MSVLSIPSSVSIRVATMGDLAFMDSLQKKHSKQLGYFPTKQFESYIEQQCVLLAEATERRSDEATKGNALGLPSVATSLRRSTPLGYCISKDRYLKRDELGVIYQMCVVPGEQRKLVGASLIKEVFARSAYGCKLYCCWCAQDIAANHFWESLGFIPIAFRAGSDRKRRVHIFWQRRINAEDGATPYWYPSQTNSGAIREDRLVFPIPPGTDWKEVEAVAIQKSEVRDQKSAITEKKPRARLTSDVRSLTSGPTRTRVQFGRPGAMVQKSEVRDIVPRDQMSEGSSSLTPHPRPPTPGSMTPRAKIDPKLVRAARELRDRYLERVNESPLLLAQGKYDVARVIGDRQLTAAPMQLLPAA